MLLSRRGAIRLSALAMLGSGCEAFASVASKAAQAKPGLAQLGAARGIKVGIQCGTGRFAEPVLGPFLRANFNMVTPPLKWTSLRPGAERYDFTEADQQFKDQQKYGFAIHGHNLCWNTSNPAWFPSVLSKQNAREYLTSYISAVVGRYRGRVDSWDVVNEPIAVWNHRSDGLRTGPWLDLIGPEYLDIAFHTAAATDSGALRTLNLNGCEDNVTGQATRAASLGLVSNLVKRGVPIQAVALEAHLDGPWRPGNKEYIAFLGALQNLGVQVYISELDVNDTAIRGSDSQVQSAVADTYSAYLKDVFSVVPLKRLIFWSMSDRFDWYGKMAASQPRWRRADGRAHHLGITDVNYAPNQAYTAIWSVLRGLPSNLQRS